MKKIISGYCVVFYINCLKSSLLLLFVGLRSFCGKFLLPAIVGSFLILREAIMLKKVFSMLVGSMLAVASVGVSAQEQSGGSSAGGAAGGGAGGAGAAAGAAAGVSAAAIAAAVAVVAAVAAVAADDDDDATTTSSSSSN